MEVGPVRFEPDVIPYLTPSVRQPEKRLWRAVFEDGIRCAFGRGNKRENGQRWKRIRAEAQEWLTDPNSSFGLICQAIDIHPDYIKRLMTDAKKPKWKLCRE